MVIFINLSFIFKSKYFLCKVEILYLLVKIVPPIFPLQLFIVDFEIFYLINFNNEFNFLNI